MTLPENAKTRKGEPIPISHLTEVFGKCIRCTHHNFVFTHKGERIKYSKLRYHFDRAVDKAGIEDFTFHDFRHTCINNWRKQGHDYFKIMKASGHKTLTVFKRYNTVDEEELKSLAVKVEVDEGNSGDKSAEL